jgi:hypothetical protein
VPRGRHRRGIRKVDHHDCGRRKHPGAHDGRIEATQRQLGREAALVGENGRPIIRDRTDAIATGAPALTSTRRMRTASMLAIACRNSCASPIRAASSGAPGFSDIRK